MDRAPLLRALHAHARDAVAHQALEPGLRHWSAQDGIVTYCETSGGWVAAGGPLAEPARIGGVASAFVREARSRGRRASFFACDDVTGFGDDFACIPIGEQPIWHPSEWAATLRGHRRLREQLRRARAKGVRIRRVAWNELDGTVLRERIDALAARWLASRPMEPMRFLVTLALFEEPELHRYYVAERAGEVVAFLSIIPSRAGRHLLAEDLVRERLAPNGTTELLFDQAMRDAETDGTETLTWGLAPLAGSVPWPMRALGLLGRGLYDFQGLRSFKARLHPRAWQPVFVVYPRGAAWPLCVVDALRAFAGGSLFAFGARTLARHPLVLAWLLTLALIPWTAALAVLLVFHAAAPIFGYPRPELLGWVVFDSMFATLLVRAFWRPRVATYLILAFAAASDAALSALHVLHVGLGITPLTASVRVAATLAPALATLGLLRCASHVGSSTPA
jgi:phosphatidylglycerol lysyltransferase